MLIIDAENPPIAENEVRAAFFRRSDIRALPAAEQEARWQEHAAKVAQFWALFHGEAAAEDFAEALVLRGIPTGPPS